MKVLVTTKETQGQRDSDFFWTEEGELAYLGMICDRDRGGDPDGGCGCGRAFTGKKSLKGTTTVKVVEREDLDFDDYAELLGDAVRDAGWNAEGIQGRAEHLAATAGLHSVGSILEKRGERIRCRTPKS